MYLDHITDDELADVGALLENGVRLGLEVMRLVQKYRTDKTGGEELLEVMEAYRKETPFFFKGDITDLSYFLAGEGPGSEIAGKAAGRAEGKRCTKL